MSWSDELWEERDRTRQEGDGRYGCLVVAAIVCLMAWMLVAACMESAQVVAP